METSAAGYEGIPKGKKENVGSVRDWINDLSDDVLTSILSSLSVKEAVKTSSVSKRWRFVWRNLAHLDVNYESCMPAPDSKCTAQEIISGITGVIFSQQSQSIPSCRIFISPDESPEIIQQKVNWVYLLKENKSLENLAVEWESHPDETVWPAGFFRGANLRKVELLGDYFLDASPFQGCSNLKTLKLHSVKISDQIVVGIVKTCVNLETLFLIQCEGLLHFRIETQTLKHLEIDDLRVLSLKLVSKSLRVLSISSISSSSYDIRCPNLSELSIDNGNSGDLLARLTGLLGNGNQSNGRCCFKVMTLRTNFNLDNWYDVITLRYLLRAWECLQHLYIVNKGYEGEHPYHTLPYPQADFWKGETTRIMVDQLKVVHLEGFTSREKEMAFVSHLIQNAEVLKRLIIKIDVSFVGRAKRVERELLSLPRGSENASIIFRRG